jgi:hypothetical protein
VLFLCDGGQTDSQRLLRGKGGVSMKTAAEYRAMAEECFSWASQTYTDEVRQAYLQLAQIWLDTASKLDGLPPTRTKPTLDKPILKPSSPLAPCDSDHDQGRHKHDENK